MIPHHFLKEASLDISSLRGSVLKCGRSNLKALRLLQPRFDLLFRNDGYLKGGGG